MTEKRLTLSKHCRWRISAAGPRDPKAFLSVVKKVTSFLRARECDVIEASSANQVPRKSLVVAQEERKETKKPHLN